MAEKNGGEALERVSVSFKRSRQCEAPNRLYQDYATRGRHMCSTLFFSFSPLPFLHVKRGYGSKISALLDVSSPESRIVYT